VVWLPFWSAKTGGAAEAPTNPMRQCQCDLPNIAQVLFRPRGLIDAKASEKLTLLDFQYKSLMLNDFPPYQARFSKNPLESLTLLR